MSLMDIAQLSKELDVEALCAVLPFMRKELGLSQVSLAVRLPITQTAISDWERQRKVPSRRNERRLREVLWHEARAQEQKKSTAAFKNNAVLMTSKGR